METTLNKNKEGYGYEYTDLAEIHRYLESINSKYIQKVERIDGDDYIFTKRCFDNKWEDEWIQGSRVVQATLNGVKNPAQENGSALTYARRYSVLMAYGLCTTDDDAQSLSETKEPTLEDAKNYVLTFGKYAGKKLKDIDTHYLDWLREYGKDPYIKKCVDLINPLPSEDEQEQILTQMTKLSYLINETNTDREQLYKHYGVTSDGEMSLEQLKDAVSILEKKVQ